MSTPEHLEVARLLVIEAAADLSAARLLGQAKDQDDGVIGFHAQQAVEKAFKAILAVREADIPRTHDLVYLAELLAAAGAEVPTTLAAVAWLNPWAVTMRYDEIEERLDRAAALASGDAAITWARAVLTSSGDSDS